ARDPRVRARAGELMLDVIVVGAGLAGLTAARALARRGLAVEIVEATARVGGRAHTLRDHGAGPPVALGPQYRHGGPPATPAMVREAGVELEPVAETHHVVEHGRLVEAGTLWQTFGRLLEDAAHGPDVSARDYLARGTMSVGEARLFALFVEGFY